MNIGELFINLGIKGADSAGKALGGVKSALGEVKDMSLEAKAAIIGVIYGLERMMSQSAQMGTGLTNFNALTGVSTKELQQWQYAARQAGVSGDEMASSMKAVQNSMTNMLLGKGAPEGIAMLANKVGFDPAKARDTLYVMGQLQKFAQTVPVDVGNAMIKSFGVSEGTISAMRRNMFTPDNFKKAPTYSDGEVKQLDKVNVAWGNLGQNIQMAFGHFTAKHGMQLVKDIGKITKAVFDLVTQLTILGDKIQIFEKLSATLTGIANVMALVSELMDAANTGQENPNAKLIKKQQGEWLPGLSNSPFGRFLGMDPVDPKSAMPRKEANPHRIAPPVKGNEPKPGAQNIEINQNLNFQHDGKDHAKTSDSTKKAVTAAFRQLSSQAQEV